MADSCTSTVLGKRKPAGALPWEHVKPDVFRIYILEGQTLNITMTEIEAIYGLTAKETRWKEKLKEWDFVKNILTQDWQWMRSKWMERKYADIKTVFYCRHIEVASSMFEEFEKRGSGTVAFNGNKPSYIAYYPSSPEESGSSSRVMDPLPYLGAYLDPGRHPHSVCSLDTNSENDLASSTNSLEAAASDDVDKWLSGQRRPFPHRNWLHQFSNYADAITSHRRTILEEISDFEEILSQSIPQDDCFQDFLSQAQSHSPDLFGIGDHLPIVYLPGAQIEQKNSTSKRYSLDHSLSLEVTLAKYQYEHGETGTPTLKQHFEIAKELEGLGYHQNAEYHCRKIIEKHWQTDVETLLGMILAKVGRIVESMSMLSRALTSFILHFDTNSLDGNARLFEQIELLFTELVLLMEPDHISLSVCFCRLMATLSSTSYDAGVTMAQIHPQLFTHGFSLAYEYSLLGLTGSAAWIYQVLLQYYAESLDIVDHAMEKATAHQRYGVLLREQENWRSSANQLLEACKSAKHSVTFDSRLCKTLESDYLKLLPHLEKLLADQLRECLDRIRPQNSLPMRNSSELVGYSHVDDWLNSDPPISATNFRHSPLSQLEQFERFMMPPKMNEAVQVHPSEELTVLTSSASMSGRGSHDRVKTWPDGTWDEYANILAICDGISTLSTTS